MHGCFFIGLKLTIVIRFSYCIDLFQAFATNCSFYNRETYYLKSNKLVYISSFSADDFTQTTNSLQSG